MPSIFTRNASKNTTGYILSSGRFCHSLTSSSTASVTVLMKSAPTSTLYWSSRNPWMSRTVMPRAYIAMMRSSNPSNLRCPLATSSGSKLPSRSRGTAISISPSSVFTVLAL